ncbi:hypothetical protein [Glycomyces sp. YM15]|uniref:hypothetical protein n=1 Tax=Glycomyces sp. YM15 TaxID=2800446 RepID=UPI001963DA02|nr:hypothetical protein [Glycomyces sp. YM15]
MSAEPNVKADTYEVARRRFHAEGHGTQVRILGTVAVHPGEPVWNDLARILHPKDMHAGGIGVVLYDEPLSCGAVITTLDQLATVRADMGAGRPVDLRDAPPYRYLFASGNAWEQTITDHFQPWHAGRGGVIADSNHGVVVYEFTNDSREPGVAWHCRVCHAEPRHGSRNAFVYNSPMLRLQAAHDAGVHLRQGHNVNHSTQLLVNRPCATCVDIDASTGTS